MNDLSNTATVCANCRHYQEHSVGHSVGCGDCHRYPPIHIGGDTANEKHRWRHPLVAHNGWCGEFSGR